MKKLFLFLMLFVVYNTVSAQNYKFQALYIYNIARLVEWPSVEGSFVVGVVGSKGLTKEITTLAQRHKLYGYHISVRTISPTDLNVKGCHLVYVGRSSSSKLAMLVDKIGTDPILVFSDKPGTTGAGINFIDNTENLTFEIYPTKIKSQNLNISNSLLSLGDVKN